MKIYWIQLRDGQGVRPGFGITARNWDDAVAMLEQAFGVVASTRFDKTMIEAWREIKSAAELDQNHVVPNMGVIVRRGVWFPNLPGIQ